MTFESRDIRDLTRALNGLTRAIENHDKLTAEIEKKKNDLIPCCVPCAKALCGVGTPRAQGCRCCEVEHNGDMLR